MNITLVDDVAAAFAQLLIARNPRSVALSGGSTARSCYEAAARTGHDWSATTFWFGDERFVAVTHPDSNERVARAVWLDRTPTGVIHSMATAGPDPEIAACNYESSLRNAPPLDLVHLGLGPDGHTASLFPGSPALDVIDRWVITTGDDLHPHLRLTLTLPAIAASALVVVTVAGVAKRDALARVQTGDRTAPAARIKAPEVIWIVDPDAMA